MQLSKIKQIFLYREGSPEVDLDEIKQYLQKHGFTAKQVETPLNLTPDALKEFAELFAKARVSDIIKRELNPKPLWGEVKFEERRLKGEVRSSVLYDGVALAKIYRRLIPPDELDAKLVHIFFTDRLFGTFAGGRYHARVSLYWFPHLISTSGVVEAPARPREHYLEHYLGQSPKEIKDKFLDYGDPRITKALKGYAMQALFYSATGEPFCDNKNCRLYNAHWQEELIQAQLKGKLCLKHQEILRRMR
jgi:hypothetical protein